MANIDDKTENIKIKASMLGYVYEKVGNMLLITSNDRIQHTLYYLDEYGVLQWRNYNEYTASIFSSKYLVFRPIQHGLNKYLVNENGLEVIVTKTEAISHIRNEFFILINKANLFSIYNIKTNKSIKSEYIDTQIFYKGDEYLFIMQKMNKVDIFDKEFKKIDKNNVDIEFLHSGKAGYTRLF